MAYNDPNCPTCEERGVYGAVMRLHPLGWICDDCGTILNVAQVTEGVKGGSFPTAVDPFDERRRQVDRQRAEAALDRMGRDETEVGPTDDDMIADVYAEDISRVGRCVPPGKTGGESTGKAKDKVNPYARDWARRGA